METTIFSGNGAQTTGAQSGNATGAVLNVATPTRGAAHHYGPWEYDPTKRSLYCHGHEIDLQDCATPKELLREIFAVAEASWGDEKVVCGLIMAFRALLHPATRMLA